MYPLTRSTSRSRFFGLPFSPASLFAAGEQGFWYDPSDYSTLFQDSAGTTPVTAVEQAVGRMLDKSGRGNHAFQTTSAKRPVLRARYNLLTYSEQFDNGAWSKSAGVSVTPNTDIAPDGTLTADTLTSTANQIQQDATSSQNTLYTDSLYFKKTSGAAYQPGLYLLFSGGTLVIYAVRLNTDTGVATAVSAGGFTAPTSFVVTDAGNYWRLAITGNSNNNTTASLRVYPNLTAGGGAGAGSQVIWGADLRPTSQATGLIGPTYQRIAAATDYDTTGFLPYLQFDGFDDEMTITTLSTLITASEYGACVGARVIQSNTNTAVVYNNNQIMGDSAQYFSVGYVRNTVNVIGAYNWDANIDETNQPLTPPATTVLQQWHQGGNLSLSLNDGAATSVASGNTTVLVGTVNLGRGGDSVPFLVWNCYGALLRNAALTSGQRAAMLTWMNGKTGAY